MTVATTTTLCVYVYWSLFSSATNFISTSNFSISNQAFPNQMKNLLSIEYKTFWHFFLQHSLSILQVTRHFDWNHILLTTTKSQTNVMMLLKTQQYVDFGHIQKMILNLNLYSILLAYFIHSQFISK